MPSFVALNRAVLGLLILGSLVYAGTMYDRELYSTNFMDERDIKVPLHFNDYSGFKRNVASVASIVALPKMHFLAFNNKNMKKINGKWEVTRVLNSEGEEIYNKFYKNQEKHLEVDFELVGNSLIKIDKDKNQIFRISLITEFGTMALFKMVNGSFEILEAKKVVAKKVAKIKKKKEMKKVVKSDKKRDMKQESVDLVLERAINPTRSAKVLTGSQVFGSASVKGGSIEMLSVELHRGTNAVASLEIDFAEINDGGHFEAAYGNQKVSGIISSSGKNGYRVRFATGPLQGAMLNFVTEEAYSDIQDKLEEQRAAQEYGAQSQVAQEVNKIQNQFESGRARHATNKAVRKKNLKKRRPTQYEDEGYEDEEIEIDESSLDYEEIEEDYEEESPEFVKAKIKKSGFDFGKGRRIASIKNVKIKK